MVQTYKENFSRGHIALLSGNAQEAYSHWQQCHPKCLLEFRSLANAFRSIGYLTEANNLILQALEKSPQQSDLIADQASLLIDAGESERAIELFYELGHKSLKNGLIEEGLRFISNALMGMEYDATVSVQEKKIAAIEWGALALRWAQTITPLEKIPEWTPATETSRPLRVGFISGDLCDHPVGFLLLPLLQYLPTDRWEIFIYDNGSRIDNTHRQLQATTRTDHWRLIQGQQDPNITKIILADQLDVLIDLAGHTGRNRLRLMAHRLAGCQLSWLGYSGTTGLPTIDGIILDDTLKIGISDQFIETIETITPSRFCFRPPFSPQIKSPPCINNEYITFGSFNNTAKYNHELLKTWASILREVPNSRLILKWKTFADKPFCEKTISQFAEYGIDPSRIELRGFSTHRAMLDEYNEIDIALDTFPFNGGFTSLESLWMGLPLITLFGNSPIARQSASFLNALNLSKWIANSTDSYVKTAIKTASDIPDLVKQREHLRFQIMGSALYDAPQFASQFASVLERLVNMQRLKR